MPPSEPTEWHLPRGVPRGVWDYAHANHIAADYDERLAAHPLFDLDREVIARWFDRPGMVVDLGCGTGRALLPLAARGFRCVAVDLSPPMLGIVGEKAAEAGLTVWRLRANLVELGCLDDAVADYALCLFSTLGMIRGHENRRRVLEHAQRVLKPGGLLILHVHNVWFSLFSVEGHGWLAGQLAAVRRRHTEFGDKFFDDRGVAKLFVHAFRRRELLRLVRQTGFALEELTPLAVGRQRPLAIAWLFGGLRANGWIAVCRRPRVG